MGVIDRLIRRLPSHPHPPKIKEVPKVLPQVTGVPVHLFSFWASHGPTGLYSDCEVSEADGPDEGNQTSPVPGRLAFQGPVSERSTSEHSDNGRPNSVLRVDNKSGEIRTKTYSTVFVCGLGIPSRFNPCKTNSREMAQTSGFDCMTQVKTCFDCKMFDVANWVACLNGENGPGGTPSHEALSVSPQGALEISSVIGEAPSLDGNHFSTPRVVAESHKVMKGADLHPKDHSIQILTDTSNEGWGAHLEQASTKGLWSDREKRLHINVLELKCFSGSSKVQGPVSRPKSVGCYGQLNSGSLHKQTRRNPLGRDVCSPVEYHDLVPSLPNNLKSQTHSRVSKCDGRPSVQVEPSPVNRMITASAGVQTDLSKVVHSSCRSICHSSEPQSSSIRISSPRPKCLGLDALHINWSGLTAYAYPSTALLHRVIQKSGNPVV